MQDNIGKSLDNIVKIANTQEIINNINIHEGQRAYLQAALNHIMVKQGELNQTIGIAARSLDIII
jgi:hypothetical protein